MANELVFKNDSAGVDEIGFYAEMASTFLVTIGAHDKEFYPNGYQAIVSLAIMTHVYLQNKGNLPTGRMYTSNWINVLSFACQILNDSSIEFDERWPWTRQEMGEDLMEVWGGALAPKQWELPLPHAGPVHPLIRTN